MAKYVCKTENAKYKHANRTQFHNFILTIFDFKQFETIDANRFPDMSGVLTNLSLPVVISYAGFKSIIDLNIFTNTISVSFFYF